MLDEVAVEDLLEDLAIEAAEDLMLEDVTTEEIDEAFFDEALLVGAPDGTEHSLTPPDTRPPNVASEHTKLPDNSLNRNTSARPNATLVAVATEQVLPSLQIVV
ncbi:MAG: hypothetical protein V4732_01925 [Pseudomonadota bacterium]